MQFKPRVPDDKVNLPKTHPLAEAAQLIAAIAALGLLAFLLIAYFVELALWLLPHDAEVELARDLWPVAAKDAAVNEREGEVQALVDALGQGWPDNPYTLRVRIVEDDQPNAFAAPGGMVLVTEGLMDMAQSENELAFVLGHEIGHFRGRDHLRGLGRGVLFQMLLTSIGVGGGDATLLGHAGVLATLSFSRDQERAADGFGLDLVHQHYGHVAGAGVFFERMAAADPTRAVVPAFVSTHPDLRERVADVRKLARKRGYALEGKLSPKL
jgi:Zn-dependent protease with chaperone function